jgi:hypothetical protein
VLSRLAAIVLAEPPPLPFALLEALCEVAGLLKRALELGLDMTLDWD